MTAAADPVDTRTEARGRAWTPLGTVDAGAIADVDRSGRVQMRGTSWSLDWWIGAEDRWHHPSSDAAVRQRVLGVGPVVETAMRVPGGDVVQRVFGVRATSGDESGVSWDDSGVVVEIENLTAVPVALAVVLSTTTLEGDGSITMLRSEGPVLSVDGRVAAVLSKPVARSVVGRIGSAEERLAVGDDDEPDGEEHWPAEQGPIEGAYVVALPHTAVVRILLPRVDAAAVGRARRRRPDPTEPGTRWDAPAAEAIEAGWAAHTNSVARVQLPDDLLDTVVGASMRTLSLAAGDGFFDGDGTSSAALRNATLCELLVRAGLREPLGPLARALIASERLGGSIRMADGSDASVALVHAAAPLLVGSRSEAWAEDLVGPVAKAVHRIGRGKGLGDPELVHSAVLALGRVAPSLRAVGQPDVADAAEQVAARLRSAGAPSGARSAATSRWTFAESVAVAAAVRAGAPDAAQDLHTLARLAAPGVLGDRVDAMGEPDGERGIDPAATAARAAAILDLAMTEGPDGPIVLPTWNPFWFGQSAEAHGVRTRWGTASYAIRWHGERPAILWEIEPAEGIDPDGPAPRWSAPALDAAWNSDSWSGEALLGALEPPDGMTPTIVGHDHQLSGQRADTEAAHAAEPDQTSEVTPDPRSFPGEGQSFS